MMRLPRVLAFDVLKSRARLAAEMIAAAASLLFIAAITFGVIG